MEAGIDSLSCTATVLVTAATAQSGDASPEAKRASNVPLRIMPLGASVTFGVGSTTGDSYRKDLRDTLVTAGTQVNMVGTQRNGKDFANNQCEAYSGFVIEQLAAKASTAVPRFLPNLVLVDAGTNNCNKGGVVADAGKNVTALINDILRQSPGATVVLATLLVNKFAAQEQCRAGVNAQYASLVADLQRQGAKVMLADMRGPGGPTTADLNDTRHPNDAGYTKMASIWFQAIQEAQSKGFLVAAAQNGIPADGGSSATNGSTVTSAKKSLGVSIVIPTGMYYYSLMLPVARCLMF